jgi:hypothetical protein
MLSLAPHQVNEPLSMFSGDMMTVNVNLAGLPVRSTSPFFLLEASVSNTRYMYVNFRQL